MIRLQFQRGILFVDTTDDPTVLTGYHRSFFELAAGYRRDIALKHYSLNDPIVLHDVLTDTIEYLKDEGLAFELDTEAQDLLNEIEADQQSYAIAATAGLRIKTTTVVPQINVPRFHRQLKPYQIRSVHHLINVRNGANFSVPGSGKTTIVYAAFAVLHAQDIVDKLVVIGPRSSFMPWEEEFFQCFGQAPRGTRLTGSKHDRQLKYAAAEDYELFLCTYQTAARDTTELVDLCKKRRVFLILDESHNVKKFEGGVWADTVLKVARFATRRAILTGTPIPNTYEDLWTQMTFLWPGKQMLGSREQYTHRVEHEEEMSSVQTAIRPFFMRIRKADLELPLQHFERIEIAMNPYQANIYRALSNRILSELSLMPVERRKLREWRRAKMIRLLQAASNPTLLAKRSEEFAVPPLSGEDVSVLQLLEDYSKYERPAKLERAVALIRQLTTRGHKVLLWTSFILNIRMLQKELEDIAPLVLYGAIPKDEAENEEINREQQVRKFRESDQPLVLLANPAACAESISLHRICRHAIYLDRTFDCGRYMQSLDRIHRIGLRQDEDVYYFILKSIDTIDEAIDRRLEEKEVAMRALLDDEDIPIGTFDLPKEEQFAMSKELEEQIDFDATIADLVKHAEAVK